MFPSQAFKPRPSDKPNSWLLGNLELSNFRHISLVKETSNALFLAKHKHMKTVNKGKLKARSKRKISKTHVFPLNCILEHRIFIPLALLNQKKKNIHIYYMAL